MNFHVITLFPEVCQAYTDASVLGRAQKTDKGKGAKARGKKIAINYYNPRDFTKDKHHRVDQRPYGGGPGMVLEAVPVLKAIEKIKKQIEKKKKKNASKKEHFIYEILKPKIKTIVFVPSGKMFDTATAKKLAKDYTDIIMIAGHYEGVDERVAKIARTEKVSVGPYVLTGGELPAMIVTDAISRYIPGVLGKAESLEDSRVSSPEVYTRPEVLKWKNKNYKVPKVLLSGNHKEIEEWKKGRKI